MRARRYTVVVADRSSGVVRRFTISLRPALSCLAALLILPVLVGIGAKWSVRAEMDRLRSTNASLDIENGSYRVATGELTSQIQSLEGVINELGTRSTPDPAQVRAMQRLPAIVKARAAGGTAPNALLSEISKAPFSSPEDTFGVLRD